MRETLFIFSGLSWTCQGQSELKNLAEHGREQTCKYPILLNSTADPQTLPCPKSVLAQHGYGSFADNVVRCVLGCLVRFRTSFLRGCGGADKIYGGEMLTLISMGHEWLSTIHTIDRP